MRPIPGEPDWDWFETPRYFGTRTEPTYLIRIGDLRYSTRGDVTHDGHLWAGGVASLRSARNWESVTIDLNDPDWLIQGQLATGQLVTVGLYFPGVDETLALFAGFLDSADLGDPITIQCLRDGLPTAFTPRARYAQPTFNHLPAPGTTFEWNGNVFTVTADA